MHLWLYFEEEIHKMHDINAWNCMLLVWILSLMFFELRCSKGKKKLSLEIVIAQTIWEENHLRVTTWHNQINSAFITRNK